MSTSFFKRLSVEQFAKMREWVMNGGSFLIETSDCNDAMAALRAGMRVVVIPRDNEPDLAEIDPAVRRALHFVSAETMDEVLAVALAVPERPERRLPGAVMPPPAAERQRVRV